MLESTHLDKQQVQMVKQPELQNLEEGNNGEQQVQMLKLLNYHGWIHPEPKKKVKHNYAHCNNIYIITINKYISQSQHYGNRLHSVNLEN